MNRQRIPAIAAALLTAMAFSTCAIATGHAAAKKKQPSDAQVEIPDITSDYIFGFTSPTGLGNAGDLGFSNESDGRVRKRDGSYSAYNAKFELGYTISQPWWVAASVFASRYRITNVTDLTDASIASFDGLSFEIAHRLIMRSAANPFAVTISIEPRWARIDGVSGRRSDAYNAAFKLFTDAVIVPDRIFWAANLMWTPQRAQDINNHSIWLKTSSTFASTALTFRLSPQLFVGAEARHLATFDRGWMDDRVGYAVYVGPTLLWRITDKVVFNTTYQPQVSGKSITNPGLRLDLDNYERAQFRAKLSIALN